MFDITYHFFRGYFVFLNSPIFDSHEVEDKHAMLIVTSLANET